METIQWKDCNFQFKYTIIDRKIAFQYRLIQIGKNQVAIVDVEQEKSIFDMLLEKFGIKFEIYHIEYSDWKSAIAYIYSLIEEIQEKATTTHYNPENLFNLIINEAVLQNASDIHFILFSGRFIWALRIDGFLYKYHVENSTLSTSLLTYIKYVAKIDMVTNSTNVDGKNCQIIVDDHKYTMRFSIMNAFDSTVVTIRIFGEVSSLNPDNMLSQEYNKALRQFINKKQGMAIISGSTGSGKSSTLYSIACNAGITCKVMSIEDPVEFIAPGINQIEVNPSRGNTVISTMKSLLRQDPDIIILNEIRDKETAEFACNMSVSGHLLLTTIHCQSAQLIPIRMMNLGITNPILLGQIDLVACQHLVILLCKQCKIKMQDGSYKKGGCNYCRNTGYAGRLLVEEFFTCSDQHKTMLRTNNITEYLRSVDEILYNKTISDKVKKLFDGGLIDKDELLKVIS